MFFSKKRDLSLGKPAPMRINMLFVGSAGTGKKTLLQRLAESYEVEIIWKASHTTTTDNNNNTDGAGQSTRHRHHRGHDDHRECEGNLRIEEVCCFYYASPTGDCEFHFYDYVSFGDLINNECCSSFLRSYLLHCHGKWMNLNVNKYTDKERNLRDERIHLLFAIFTPHALSALLLEMVRNVCGLAPIVPVVTKADSMTREERKDFLIELRQALDCISKSLNRTAIVDFQEEGEFVEHEEDTGRHIEEDGVTELPTSTATNPALLCTIVDTHQSANELASSVASVEQHASVIGGESGLLVDFPSSAPFSAGEDVNDMENESTCSSVEEVPYTVASHSAASMMMSTESQESTALPKVRNIFAVICSNSRTTQRCYPWGSVNSLDENYSDFRRLQRLIFESGNLTHLRSLCQEMSIGLLRHSNGEGTGNKQSEAVKQGEGNHPPVHSSSSSKGVKPVNTTEATKTQQDQHSTRSN
eukprot:gene10387-11505_t